jgi:CBS-domain-containing membrane protein
VMTRAIIAGSPGDDLRGTWELMVRRRLQNLPLLGPNRRPVGTLDIRDALQTIIELEQAQESQLVNYIAGVGYR